MVSCVKNLSLALARSLSGCTGHRQEVVVEARERRVRLRLIRVVELRARGATFFFFFITLQPRVE